MKTAEQYFDEKLKYAAYAAAYDADAAYDALKKIQLQTADICRKYLTKMVYKKLKI